MRQMLTTLIAQILGATIGVVGFATVFSHQATAQPLYENVPVTLPGQAVSNVEGVSSDGLYAIGTSDADAVAWTPGGGTVSLPGIPGRNFQSPQSVNDSGIGAGFGATTFFGSSPLPGTWDIDNGTSDTLPLVAGASIGTAQARGHIRSTGGGI